MKHVEKKKGIRSERARSMLIQAAEKSGRGVTRIGEGMGYCSHSAITQYMKGVSPIPLGAAYKLGLVAGMDVKEAKEFFLVNLEDRDPVLGEAIFHVFGKPK